MSLPLAATPADVASPADIASPDDTGLDVQPKDTATTPDSADATSVDACVPNCQTQICGDDGCGGLCGTCADGLSCVDGQCASGCTADCTNKVCGDDGCGGSCGTCADGLSCNGAQCVCQPNCGGKQCGNDGCGGSCGTCAAGLSCNGAQCVCLPNCGGKQCGNDGCGGVCGTCPSGQSCNESQCEGPPLPSITFSTSPGTAGETLLVWVKDTIGWAYIGLKASGPCGTEDLLWNGVTESGGVFTWEYNMSPPASGSYSLVFTADQGATTVVTGTLSVNGTGDCTQPSSICTAAGASCVDEYPENKVCTATGVAKVVTCHKFGTCSGAGDGTLCSWGAGSYCDDPCDGQVPTPVPANKFGIGLVGPGDITQLDWAHELAGNGGHVLMIFPGIQKSTTGPDASWVAAVQGVYDRNLVPVIRLGPPWGQMNIRSQSDDPNHMDYSGLAQAYRSVVAGLPMKADQSVYIQVHNEPNLCHEWVCGGGGTLDAATIAAEYAAFFRDVADALHDIGDPRIRVSLGALAPGGNQICNCCGDGSCGGNPGWTGLQFLQAMQAAVPDIWTRLDYLATHSYPASNIGWGFFLPYDQSGPGLHYFEQELAIVGAGLDVLITETGWSTQRPEGGPFPSEQQKADWTVLAYQNVWLPDARIKGVMPFILVDEFWGEQEGFGWVHLDGSHYPVFDSVRSYRCTLGLGPC